MRFYYVNPAETNHIEGLNAQQGWRIGQRVTLADGTKITDNLRGPGANMYQATENNAATPAYHRRVADSRAFVGSVGDYVNARVQETRNFQPWDIADVYQAKREAIAAQDRLVRYNAVDTSLSVNWWLICTEAATAEIVAVGIASNSRQHARSGWPTGPNAPWLGIFNAATGDARRYQITDQATWNTLELEWAQHLQATGNATDASRTALDAAYADGAGDWQAVADHDPADPAWGYPPTVDPNDLNAATV